MDMYLGEENMNQVGYQKVLNELYRVVETTMENIEPMIEQNLDVWQMEAARKCLMDGFCSVFKACVVEKIATIQEHNWQGLYD